MNTCRKCGKQLASPQSLWNHRQRCMRDDVSDGKGCKRPKKVDDGIFNSIDLHHRNSIPVVSEQNGEFVVERDGKMQSLHDGFTNSDVPKYNELRKNCQLTSTGNIHPLSTLKMAADVNRRPNIGFQEKLHKKLQDAGGNDTHDTNEKTDERGETKDETSSHSEDEDRPTKQRVLCTNCSTIMASDDYRRHRRACATKHGGESSKLTHPQNEIPLAEKEKQNDFKVTDEWKDDDSFVHDTDKEVDSDNDAENISDDEMDGKLWGAIANWCIKSNTDALEGFRFWYNFCYKLEHDFTIEKIMESVHAYRDSDDSLGFKEALNLALMKRKYLIYETLQTYKTEGIWKVLLEQPDEGRDVFEMLTKYILMCRSMRRDPIFIAVNEMIQDSMDDIDPMSFEEALNHTIEAKADKIFEAVGDLPRRDTSAHVWERIGKTFNPSSQDSFSEVRYFIDMEYLIKDDPTFQSVLSKINHYLESGDSLDVALHDSVKEEASQIHESFATGGELYEAMKADEFGDSSEELSVFKTYVLYHLAIKHDDLFQSIKKTIDHFIELGMEYNDSVNRSIEMNKARIRSTIGHPWIPGLKYLVNPPL